MFRKISLRQRMLWGFGIILILLGIVSAVSLIEMRGTVRNFTLYREMARDTNLAGRLQANMLMVRMNFKDFLITGSQKDIDEYNQYRERMLGFLNEAKIEITRENRAKKIAAVDSVVGTYDNAFQQVVIFRHQRDDWVKNILDVEGPRMENWLTEILETAKADNIM